MTESLTLPPARPPKMNLMWKVGRLVARFLTTFGWDLKSYGLRNVPRSGGVLLVSNHQSYLDPIVIAAHLYRPMSYMARSGLFENKYFGWLIRSFNAFPIKQGEGDLGAIRETVRRLHEGHMLNIFPEGSRTEDGELQKILPGAALVIRKARVPVVPTIIEGSFDAWKRGWKLPRPGLIRVIYGEPMYHLHELKPAEIVKEIDRELRVLMQRVREMDHWEYP